MTILEAQTRAKKREARLILEAELPERLQVTKKPYPEQQALWLQGMRFVDSWAKQGGSTGLLIQGGVGRGKTELLALMLFMLADLYGKTALFINCREIGLELRESYDRTGEGRSEWKILEQARKRDIVALDDVGSEGGPGSAEHVKELTKGLIDLCSASPKLFIATGNLNDESLAKLLHDPRADSRRAPWERLVFTDTIPDYRKKGRK